MRDQHTARPRLSLVHSVLDQEVARGVVVVSKDVADRFRHGTIASDFSKLFGPSGRDRAIAELRAALGHPALTDAEVIALAATKLREAGY